MKFSKFNHQCLYRALVVFSVVVYGKLNAQQNLVPNPSFEFFTSCPDNSTYLGQVNGKPDLWNKPDNKNSVYYNFCSNNYPKDGVPYNIVFGYSYQWPKSGLAYMAMGYYNANYQDCIQTKLKDSLKPFKKYYAEYYVSLSNACVLGCNNIGMLFTKNVVYADTINKNILLANPQIRSYGNPIVTDTMGWVKISGIFTAQGGEQYLTLGNFKLTTQTQTKLIAPFGSGYYGSGYYVDDVAVYEINDSFCLKADAGRDTTIKHGDSIFIGSYTNGIDTIKWYNSSGQVIDSVQPGFWVKPTSNTFHVVEQQVNGCITKDTINILVQPLPVKFLNVQVNHTPNPSQEGNIIASVFWQSANEINVSHFNIQRSIDGIHFETIGKVVAKNNSYNEYNYVDNSPPLEGLGVVYYRVVGIDRDGKTTNSTTKQITINKKQETVLVYPNPTKNILNIESKTALNEIKVFNSLGKLVSSINCKNVKTFQLNTEQLKHIKGVYILSFQNGEKIKFIKE